MLSMVLSPPFPYPEKAHQVLEQPQPLSVPPGWDPEKSCDIWISLTAGAILQEVVKTMGSQL